MKVAVLGAGSWGSALAQTIAENGHRVYLWGHTQAINKIRKTRRVKRSFDRPLHSRIATADSLKTLHHLSQRLHQYKLIIIAIPSYGFREICQVLKDQDLPKETAIVGTCKGIEDGTLLFADQIVVEVLGKVPYGHLGGPGFAKGLLEKEDTRLVIASTDIRVREMASQALNNSFLFLQPTSDLMGLQVAGATRTPASVVLGAASALKFGASYYGGEEYLNTKAAMIGRILWANAQLGMALGGSLETFLDVAGAGDLILCLDRESRNFRLGDRIVTEVPDNLYSFAQKRVLEIQRIAREIGTVEGYQTCKAIYELAQRLGVEMPWVEEVYRVCHEGKPIKDAMETIRQRAMRRA